MRHMIPIAQVSASLLLSILIGSNHGQDLERAAKAFDMIGKFANDICNKPDMRGKSSSVDVQGHAKAEVSKLVKQLADLKIDGAMKFDIKDYEGLLQKDLLPALQESTKCKERIYNDLKDRFLPKVVGRAPSLNVRVDPDTVGIRIGAHTPVSYKFREINGSQATVEAQNVRWLLDNGTELSSVKNARILGGSFSVRPNDGYELIDNVFMPPEIAQKALAAGTNLVQLETTFLAKDADERTVRAKAVLRIGIMR